MMMPPRLNHSLAAAIGSQLLSPWRAEAARRTGWLRVLGEWALRRATILSATGTIMPTTANKSAEPSRVINEKCG
jgi:hypothetical protein